jgi:hypothetical protein
MSAAFSVSPPWSHLHELVDVAGRYQIHLSERSRRQAGLGLVLPRLRRGVSVFAPDTVGPCMLKTLSPQILAG